MTSRRRQLWLSPVVPGIFVLSSHRPQNPAGADPPAGTTQPQAACRQELAATKKSAAAQQYETGKEKKQSHTGVEEVGVFFCSFVDRIKRNGSSYVCKQQGKKNRKRKVQRKSKKNLIQTNKK